MSRFTDQLEYIWDWLESTNLELFDCYNLGLDQQEIDGLIDDLPFRLSQEFYELYQWRNGKKDFDFNNYVIPTEFLFPEQLRADVTCSFLSIQAAKQYYDEFCQLQDEEYWSSKWFPIAAFENKRLLYIVGDLNPSPVYLWDTGSQLRTYKSLTSFISVIAECCELGLYQVVQDEYGEEGEMIILIDDSKLEDEEVVYRKYNS